MLTPKHLKGQRPQKFILTQHLAYAQSKWVLSKYLLNLNVWKLSEIQKEHNKSVSIQAYVFIFKNTDRVYYVPDIIVNNLQIAL